MQEFVGLSWRAMAISHSIAANLLLAFACLNQGQQPPIGGRANETGRPMNRHCFLLATTLLACTASMAQAGETILYDAAPSWAEPADFDKALASGEQLVLVDRQVRIEDGVVHAFSDVAYRIENPEALAKLGTLTLGWLPDKGDLTVHRLEIVRGGMVTDLLAGGARYEVLRRETQLEQRSLDGALTATIAAPGLKVGDVLRFSQTISKRDQALAGEVQVAEGLLAKPANVGFGRVRVSWPAGETMIWRAGPAVALEDPVAKGGFQSLSLTLPLAKREEMPNDAPGRYTLSPLLQVTSFADWREVSRTMGQHFSTDGSIAPGSPLALQVERIAAASEDPRERAALALKVVQDEIGYLLNGMNGGNYLPQKPAETWANRYGDCKAKSLLLLAMLREIGIESEAVLVRSSNGDLVSALLPMPAAFDHVIVRATIEGTDYWLDGTAAGTRIDTMGEVPAVHYALPLRPEGADLLKVEQRWPTALDRIVRVIYDYRAGLDMPALYEAEVEARGIMGARVRPQVDETDPDKRIEYVADYLKELVGEGIVHHATIAYDDASGVATIRAKGLLGSGFEFERDRGKLAISLPSSDFKFEPDRARAAWRDIPVAVGGPLGFRKVVTVLLPEGDPTSYELSGRGDLDEEVAGVRIRRRAELAGNRLVVEDTAIKIPSEIPVADLADARGKVARLRSGDPLLRADDKAVRYWQREPADMERRFAHLEEAYAAIIAHDPEDAWRWALRGGLRAFGRDKKGALADYDRAIALDPSAELHFDRAQLHRQLGALDAALTDAREAYDLERSPGYAMGVASLLAEAKRFDEGLAVLDELDVSGDDRIDTMIAKADILGEAGRADEGWNLLGQALSERPGDGTVLNAQCWFMGTWRHALDEALKVCDRAVQANEYSADALDSRALVHYRLAHREEALADLQAALSSAPSQSASLYLRGIMLLEAGDAAGKKDVAEAERLYSGIDRYYARFGIGPTK